MRPPIWPMKSAHLSPFMQRPRAFTRLQRRVARHRLGGSFLLGRLAGAKTVEFDHRRSRDWLHEQVAHCPDQRVDPVRREPRHLPIEIRCERAHLIFEGRKRTDVKDAPRLLLVERGDRFGADDFASRGVHGGKWHIGIDHAQGGLDHLAAIVYLSDNAVALVLTIE